MPSNETSLPSRAEFLKLARTHTLVPLYRTLTADLETPVTAFLRLAADEPECFLLESVEQGEKIGRYTFIGIRPFRKMTSHGRAIEITENGKLRRVEGDIFALWKEFLSSHKPARIAGLPRLPPEPSASLPTMLSARSNACQKKQKTISACPMPA